ncbi:MAG: CaiB/BaiF CoA-transferase family protein [Pseudomonadota bacterium]
MGVLNGIRIVEFEGLGPCPFCGMLFADLGADVILIERKGGADMGRGAVFNRGKRSIALDLKNEAARDIALDIIATADALIEGMRPGVMERLGLGPDVAQARNRKLVYGRLTGWGQTGPLAHTAGHDINYVARSGAAWYAGGVGSSPTPPPTLVGDVGGGSLYLAIGVLAGVLRARETGEGAIVDAAIVDGSAHMMNLLYSLRAAGGLPDERGASMLDGAHFYSAYECADGKWLSVGPLEPKFYQEFLQKLGLQGDKVFLTQFDQAQWPSMKSRLADIFKKEARGHWEKVFDGSDACVAPILPPSEAAQDAHMKSRDVLREIDGVLQAVAAPRFDGQTPESPSPPPLKGRDTEEILSSIGIDEKTIAACREAGAI